MDFLNRNNSSQFGAKPAAPATAPVVSKADGGNKCADSDRAFFLQPRWMRGMFLALLLSGTVLAISVVCLMAFGGSREGHYVQTKKYQAVFLTNGQVYFAKVKTISPTFINIQDIYYLNTQDQTTNTADKTSQTSMSLVKLGCELHGPTDQMIINREQVTFWENLSDSGKVVKAIAQWQKDNPKGQTCSTTSATTTQSNTAATTSTTTATPPAATAKQ